MHIPKFPPVVRDWEPGNPMDLEPPLPRFLWNPGWGWAGNDLKDYGRAQKLAEEFGEWQVKRAISSSPKGHWKQVESQAKRFLNAVMGG